MRRKHTILAVLLSVGIYTCPANSQSPDIDRETAAEIIELYNTIDALEVERSFSTAIPLLEELEGELTEILGDGDIDTLLITSRLANAYYHSGDLRTAERLYNEVIPKLSASAGALNEETRRAAYWMANVQIELGNYAAAERFLLQAISSLRPSVEDGSLEHVPDFTFLATIFARQERHEEAEALLRYLAGQIKANHGRFVSEYFYVVVNLANRVDTLGRPQEADLLYQDGLEVAEELFPPDSEDTLLLLMNRAIAWAKIPGRLTEARNLAQSTLQKLEDIHGPDGQTTQTASLMFSSMPTAQPDEAPLAVDLANLTREKLEGELGLSHPRTLQAIDVEARNIAGQDQIDRANVVFALELWEHGMKGLPDFYNLAQAPQLTDLTDALPLSIETYLTAAVQSNLPRHEVAARTLEAQGWLTLGSLDVTLSEIPLGAAQDDLQRSALTERRVSREVLHAARDAFKLQSTQFSESSTQKLERAASALLEAEARHASAERSVARLFPDELERRSIYPLSTEDAQRLLSEDEALIAYASTERVLIAWLVTKDFASKNRIFLPREQLNQMVTNFRSSMDGKGNASGDRISPHCAVNAHPRNEFQPFDRCLGYDLYELVLGQIFNSAQLQDISSLIIVPDGPLERMPFSALVSKPPSGSATRWLADDFAVSVLPTTSALRMLRDQTIVDRETDGPPNYLGLAPAMFDRLGFSPSEVSPLPSTAVEVEILAQALDATSDQVKIGTRASEDFVQKSNLLDYDIIAFATHAFLSGEMTYLTGGEIPEPALLLNPGEGHDGFLTATEIARLKIDADLVILSACNTASGDADDAEGLSGLARAFFLAGARGLFVSHWAVNDASTQKLISRTIRYTSENKLTNSEALRCAMLDLRDGKSDPARCAALDPSDGDALSDGDTLQFSHPAFWAPFDYVGLD